MEQAKRHAIEFLEKEIKTYMALARFLSKEGIKERVQVGRQILSISPKYYKDRIKEARTVVNELRKPS